MKDTRYFTGGQEARLKERIAALEKSTGVELAAAVVGKCDSYPEIPWKAFALAAAAGALAVMVHSFAGGGCALLRTPHFAASFILGAGAVFALLAVLLPPFGRLFLDRERAETETGQYGRAFFLERELFRSRGRTGILVLVGLYERRVVILPDSGVASRIDPAALDAVIGPMLPHLRRKELFEALLSGLEALEAELVRAGFGPAAKPDNEIADAIIQERGDGR